MTTEAATRKGPARVAVQRFGTNLSNLVMPNIGAFIAWGLITALFMRSGWINVLAPQPDDGWVARLGGWGAFQGEGIVGPSITYLLPLLIGNTGGRVVYGARGGVVGAIATMGVIAGTSVPMFLGAMVMGPLGGVTMKKLDAAWQSRIRPGFEMLVNNFSAGIWGGTLAVFGFFVMGPIVSAFSNVAGTAVGWLVASGLLPLTSVLIEPGKVLFLNNAINHGILTPLATQQAAGAGKSVLFLLEANPGPGLGLLLAFLCFGKGPARASAPAAAIIHFLGGIHEIYFPYVLMKPILILAMIAGGMTGVFVNVSFGVGLRGPAAPGSVFAVYLQASLDSYVGVTLAIISSAAVTMLVASLMLGFGRGTTTGADDLAAATTRMEDLKGRTSAVAGQLRSATSGPIRTIVFACDAGVGSSAMGASMLRAKIADAGVLGVSVANSAIGDLDHTADLVITQSQLTDRARRQAPHAIHVCVDDFIDSPAYADVLAMLRPGGGSPSAGDVLAPGMVRIHPGSVTRDEALQEATDMLVGAGVVTPAYYAAMQDRERAVSTYIGHELAIPHGTIETQGTVLGTAITFVRYDGGVDWDGQRATFVVGIAGKGSEHLEVFAQIAALFSNPADVEKLRTAATSEELFALLAAGRTA